MDPLHATIEEFAAEGYTHVECFCPRCRVIRLRPISWLPRISIGLTIAQLSERLRRAECGGQLHSVKPGAIGRRARQAAGAKGVTSMASASAVPMRRTASERLSVLPQPRRTSLPRGSFHHPRRMRNPFDKLRASNCVGTNGRATHSFATESPTRSGSAVR